MFKRLKEREREKQKGSWSLSNLYRVCTQHIEPDQCGPKWGSHFISSQHIVIKKQ